MQTKFLQQQSSTKHYHTDVKLQVPAACMLAPDARSRTLFAACAVISALANARRETLSESTCAAVQTAVGNFSHALLLKWHLAVRESRQNTSNMTQRTTARQRYPTRSLQRHGIPTRLTGICNQRNGIPTRLTGICNPHSLAAITHDAGVS
jgi:hypothetical protein